MMSNARTEMEGLTFHIFRQVYLLPVKWEMVKVNRDGQRELIRMIVVMLMLLLIILDGIGGVRAATLVHEW